MKHLVAEARRLLETRAYELGWLLAPPGKTAQIGAEKGRPKQNGVALFVSPHGSHRYVYYVKGKAASGLQVMVHPKTKRALAANVWTHPDHRRHKLATKLWKKAKQDYPKLALATDQSDLGKAWTQSI